MFNAVSTGILGNESLSTELRVRCTIEMAINGLKYTDNMGDLILVSRDYVDSLLACAMPGSFSDAWTISALSTVINRDIESLYPPEKFRNFLASKPPKPQQTVTSTDGKLEIPNVPKLAKNPAQQLDNG